MTEPDLNPRYEITRRLAQAYSAEQTTCREILDRQQVLQQTVAEREQLERELAALLAPPANGAACPPAGVPDPAGAPSPPGPPPAAPAARRGRKKAAPAAPAPAAGPRPLVLGQDVQADPAALDASYFLSALHRRPGGSGDPAPVNPVLLTYGVGTDVTLEGTYACVCIGSERDGTRRWRMRPLDSPARFARTFPGRKHSASPADLVTDPADAGAYPGDYYAGVVLRDQRGTDLVVGPLEEEVEVVLPAHLRHGPPDTPGQERQAEAGLFPEEVPAP